MAFTLKVNGTAADVARSRRGAMRILPIWPDHVGGCAANGHPETGRPRGAKQFQDCRPMRMNEVPVVATHIVKNTEAPGGFGEAPCACVPPAITNAIFAVMGKRIRTLPIDTSQLQ